jgi:hypothetical protein
VYGFFVRSFIELRFISLDSALFLARPQKTSFTAQTSIVKISQEGIAMPSPSAYPKDES